MLSHLRFRCLKIGTTKVSISKRAFFNLFGGKPKSDDATAAGSTSKKSNFYVPESKKKPEIPRTLENEAILYKGLNMR